MVKVPGPSGRLIEAVSVEFDAQAEPWTTLMLSDGTTLKMRPNLQNIVRLDSEFDQSGNPVYVVYQAPPTIRVVKAKLHGEPTIGQVPKGQQSKSGDEIGYR